MIAYRRAPGACGRQLRGGRLPSDRVRSSVSRRQPGDVSTGRFFMNRKIVGIAVGMCVVLGASVGAVRAQNSPAGAGIDAALRGAVERKDVPGVVALITDRKRVLYQGAFGVTDVSTGRALAADALFRIASMTKPVTSTAAMQLVEQGRFGLDDPVEKYLPANLKVFASFDAATAPYP